MKIPLTKLLVLTLCCCLLLTGCWDAKPVDRRSYVTMVGVDITEQGLYRVFAQVVIPRKLAGGTGGGGGGTEKTFAVLSSEAPTILEAIRNMDPVDSRQIDLGHTRVFIFSENLARQGLSHVIDYFMRFPQIPTDAWMLIAKDDMGKIMESKHYSEQMPSVYIDVFLSEKGQRTPKTIPIRLWEFHRNLVNSSLQPVVPLISLKQDVGEEPKKSGGGGDEKKKGDETEGNLQIRGTALFDRGTMIGEITAHETQYLNWLLGKRNYGSLTFEDPRFPGRNITTSIQELQLIIEPHHAANREISFKVHMNFAAFVDETHGFMLKDEKQMNAIEAAFGRHIEREIQQFITKLQQDYRVDAIAFGNAFRRHHYELWPKLNWDEEWPKAYVTFEAKTEFRNRGSTQ